MDRTKALALLDELKQLENLIGIERTLLQSVGNPPLQELRELISREYVQDSGLGISFNWVKFQYPSCIHFLDDPVITWGNQHSRLGEIVKELASIAFDITDVTPLIRFYEFGSIQSLERLREISAPIQQLRMKCEAMPVAKWTRKVSRETFAAALGCDSRTAADRLGNSLRQYGRQWWSVNLATTPDPADAEIIAKYLKEYPARSSRRTKVKQKVAQSGAKSGIPRR